MKCYAQINENNICIGISQLAGEVVQDNMIEIPTVDMSYLWKKHENGSWSNETYEPESTAPITEFTSMKNQIDALNIAMANIMGV